MIELSFNRKLATASGHMTLEIRAQIPKGNFVTLYGPSGAGKTSTLRIIAGLMKADEGVIEVEGQQWFNSDQKINLSPQSRKVGYVFQDYALFPHMTVRQNLEFAQGRVKDQQIISELIELTELGNLQGMKPATLSGGQQQRVALARALVQKPNILLLDEPLAALDYKIRLKLQDYLIRIHREYGLTIVLVSHDLAEISKLSNSVIVLENGKIVKSGTAEEIFVKPDAEGKFKLFGEVLKIDGKGDKILISILVQNQLVELSVSPSDINGISVGDKVVLTSMAFDPIIHKLD